MRPLPPLVISPQLRCHSWNFPHQLLISSLRHIVDKSQGVLVLSVAIWQVNPNRKGHNFVRVGICNNETMGFLVGRRVLLWFDTISKGSCKYRELALPRDRAHWYYMAGPALVGGNKGFGKARSVGRNALFHHERHGCKWRC